MIVRNNYFARLIDNAVEFESHSNGLQFVSNFIEDSFEPFSYQPQGGSPLPTASVISGNKVRDTDAYAEKWRLVSTVGNWQRALFKLYVGGENFSTPPTAITVPGGFLISNNTCDFANGYLFTWGMANNASFGPVAFVNNNLLTKENLAYYGTKNLSGLSWIGNALTESVAAPMATFDSGTTYPPVSELNTSWGSPLGDQPAGYGVQPGAL